MLYSCSDNLFRLYGRARLFQTRNPGPDIRWWENDGSENFTERRTIASSSDCTLSVYATDMDGDGDMDILGAAQRINAIIWWENKDGKAGGWVKHVMNKSSDDAFSAYAVDMDSDGDSDILGVGLDVTEIAWFEY